MVSYREKYSDFHEINWHAYNDFLLTEVLNLEAKNIYQPTRTFGREARPRVKTQEILKYPIDLGIRKARSMMTCLELRQLNSIKDF